MKTLFFLLSVLLIFQVQVKSQIPDLDFKCYFDPNGEERMQNQALILTTKTGTTNMAVIICVEKDQSTELDLDDFINAIQDQIPNFFEQATFGNYHVNVINILVKSIDYLNRKSYAFELPDTIVAKPSTFDTSYCVRPWMVKNILKQADSIYNFADYDSDGDGIVDFCMFQVARFRIYANDGTGAVINNTLYGDTTVVSIKDINNILPTSTKLYQNYPNPFNLFTTISFEIPKPSNVSLIIYDVLGREVYRLINNREYNRGKHKIIWMGIRKDGMKAASGIYFYSLPLMKAA
ncbi:MAG: T9SS type A sorting domain-containing protein [Ignavibacteriaceae bacterium]